MAERLQQPDLTEESHPASLTPQIILIVATRVVINGSYRMIYPYLEVFAAGLGVSLQLVTLPLTGRSLLAVLGPLSGPIADRYGRKIGMLAGLSLFVLGVGLVSAWPSFPAFFLALILAHMGNMVFLPALQAYLGDRVPFRRRGAVLAVTELSWSLSFIAMVPLLGLLLSRFGWVAPFWLLGVLGVLAIFLVIRLIPNDRPQAGVTGSGFWHNLRQVTSSRMALVALAFNLLISAGNEMVNLVFGVWMQNTFQLRIAALGLTAVVIGLAELSGEGATVLLVDRIGKKRAVLAGVLLTSLSAMALPLLGRTVAGAMVGLFLFYLSFEFTLVSYIPLMTEVLPPARATLMGANLAAGSLGRALGALIGPWLYLLGFGANAGAALLLNALALVALSQIRISES